MNIRALFFDVDDTLVERESVACAVFQSVARDMLGNSCPDLDWLRRSLVFHASRLWRALPTFPYCDRVGISSAEALWAEMSDSQPVIKSMRSYLATFRTSAWAAALQDCGIEDVAPANDLATRYCELRNRSQTACQGAEAVLSQLACQYRLVALTNGIPSLQRDKLCKTGLIDWFDAVIVGGDVGIGKPHTAIFVAAMNVACATPNQVVMVGDSLERDVFGAIGAGILPIWLRKEPGPSGNSQVEAVATITRLADLPAALCGLTSV